MNNYRKKFNGGLDADTDFEGLEPNKWVNASNVRTFTTNDGATDRIEDVGGTALIFNTLPTTGINFNIGGCKDDSAGRIYFFNWNSLGTHAIYCYDKKSSNTYIVLLSSQVTGGLNFSKNLLIHSCFVIEGRLYWTDNLNEPKKINAEAGIKTNQPSYVTTIQPYSLPIAYTVTTQIKRPPIFPLQVAKFYDTTFVNNLTSEKAYQFTYQFKYRDYEVSALSAYSQLISLNFKADNFNSVIVIVPFSEQIDDDIVQIDICVKHGNEGKTFIIKSYSKAKDSDTIALHNSGTTQLKFTFYDNSIGTALSAISSITSQDSVPLRSETIELAKNRIFSGSNLLGYNTPSVTSLTAVAGNYNVVNGGSYTGKIKYFYLYYKSSTDYSPNPTISSISYYYIYVSTLNPSSFYYVQYKNGIAVPATLNAADATYAWNTEVNLAYAVQRNTDPPSGSVWVYPPGQQFISYDTGSTTNILLAVDIKGLQFFKSGSSYKVSIAFYDRFRRKCGIIDTPIKVDMPLRTALQSVFASTINWTLSNINAGIEIPDWAYYYQLHVTKNRTTRFFAQIRVNSASYVLKSQAGLFTYNNPSFSLNSTYACGFDITPLASAGLGYSYNEGDLLRLFKADGSAVLLKIIGVDGTFIQTNAVDIGTLNTSTTFLIEIYTPFTPTENEGFYEEGSVYPISNPTTTSRIYSVVSGAINGDCYAIQRDSGISNLYLCEAMSPNDKQWKHWETDTGWINIIDTIGQTLQKGSIMFSDVMIEGAKVNGFNKFQPLNVKVLDTENGAIQKLVLANKVQADGSVLLAICEDETVSCYLGEQELFDTQGSAYIAYSSSVIGSTKALKGSNGTRNPESVTQHNGLVFWYDSRNGVFTRYADNGLFNTSEKKLSRATSLFSKKFKSLLPTDIEALGSRPFIIGGFDPYHQEALFSIPTTQATPPKGILADYPTVIYPYDIYDGQGKTLVYKNEADLWLNSMSFQAEKFINLDDELYSFKNGALYIHNQSQPAFFYGVQYTSKIMYSNNIGAIHKFISIGLECNKKPLWVNFRTEDPFIQSSDLIDTDFTTKEGVQYASILRDRLSPNTAGTFLQKQMSGDPLIGKTLLTMLEFEFINDPTRLKLRYSNIGNTVSKGHLLTNGNS